MKQIMKFNSLSTQMLKDKIKKIIYKKKQRKTQLNRVNSQNN